MAQRTKQKKVNATTGYHDTSSIDNEKKEHIKGSIIGAVGTVLTGIIGVAGTIIAAVIGTRHGENTVVMIQPVEIRSINNEIIKSGEQDSIIYKENIYLSLDMINEITKSQYEWDEETKTIKIIDSYREKNDTGTALTDIKYSACADNDKYLYAKKGLSIRDNKGNEYNSCLTGSTKVSTTSSEGWNEYTLEENYTNIRGVAAIKENYRFNFSKAIIKIWADGEIILEESFREDSEPLEFCLDIKNVKKLKVLMTGGLMLVNTVLE